MRTSCLVTFLAAFLSAGCGNNTTPIPPSSVVTSVTTLSVVLGDEQTGKAGEPLTGRMVVRAADERGRGVEGVLINFTVVEGEGTVAIGSDYLPGLSTRTTTNGLASVSFRPKLLGRSVVKAEVAGGAIPAVTFGVQSTALVIERWGPRYDIGFIASPCFCSEVTVPVGTRIEWTPNGSSSTPEMLYTVTATAVPEGAASFDSGVLSARDRFHFVPQVRGTWEYRDTFTGHTGRITAN